MNITVHLGNKILYTKRRTKMARSTKNVDVVVFGCRSKEYWGGGGGDRAFQTHFRVGVKTLLWPVNCDYKTAFKALFLYFNLCLGVKIDILSCSFLHPYLDKRSLKNIINWSSLKDTFWSDIYGYQKHNLSVKVM